jgi:propanol-preferring alcohol dehydrogenase
MLAMRLFKPTQAEDAPLVVTHLPKPRPAAGQVCLRVFVCGVCHTDLHIIEGDIHPPKLPVIPGHQVVGVIESMGQGVIGVHIGDRVGVPWLYNTCKNCDFCKRGEENLCTKAQFTGFHKNGGFCEYMLADARYLLQLPENISNEQAAPLLCAGIIGYRSLQKADLQPGERLGLVGFGASAHLAIQIGHYWGCETYVYTRSKEHQKHAKELGATWTGNFDEKRQKPLDRAVIFAPAGDLVPRVLERLRPGGTLAINAIYMSPIPVMEYHLIYGERTIRSVANATYQDGVDFLRLAGKIKIHSDMTLYSLEEANLALLDIKHSRLNGEAVLVISQ